MHFFVSIIAGAIFGAGLVVSDMINPDRVKAFLVISSDWDPTLAFVMAGAVSVQAVAWAVSRKLDRPILAQEFGFGNRSDITPSLVGGATIFGIGWGLIGLCPGPAIAAAWFEPRIVGLFIVCMLAGMLLHKLITRQSSPAAKQVA